MTHVQETIGRATIKIEGKVNATVVTTKFSVRQPAFDPDITESIPSAAPSATDWTDRPTAWFMRNRWYENVFYAVSRQSIAGTSGYCFVMSGITAPNEECLRVVLTKRTGNANPFDRAEVALILMGRPIRQSPGLALQSRAAGAAGDNIANYLEGENLTPNRLFEHRTERIDINDRVIYIERQP